MSDCTCENRLDDEEKEEKSEKIKNIILLIWGILCLVVAFILNKIDQSFSEITWECFSNSNFYASLSFYSFLLYTIGYLPLLFSASKECIEEIKEGNILNENTLMIIATLGAYFINEYPEALFVILFSIIGETLEDYATEKSEKSIKSLVNDMPLYAHVVKEDKSIVEKNPEDLTIGDIIEIRPGEKVSVDGKIISGASSFDLSSINGESLPKEYKEGDFVYSGSINLNSVVLVAVEKEFKDSTLAKIMDLVENQQAKKAKTEKFITKFAKIYTPIVMLIAVSVFLIGMIVSSWSWQNGGREWLYKALSILLISCPCCLVIAVPITFFSTISCGSKYGILIKGSINIEDMAHAKTIFFDKTGTLTEGKFVLMNKVDEENLLLAASLEAKSTHPLAIAIKNACPSEKLDVDKFENIPGFGIKGDINGKTYCIGNSALMERFHIQNFKEEETPYKALYLGIENGEFLSAFIVADKIKDTAKKTISDLKKEGFDKTCMLSGDDEKIAKEVADTIHLDEALGNLLPDEKLKKVEEHVSRKEGVCYVGDGINDSPSLLASDVGIAMGALGSDAAVEASDIVIMDDDLAKVAEAKRLCRKSLLTAISVITVSIVLKSIFMVLVLTGVLGSFAMIVSGLSDTGVMIICVLVALSMLFYKPKYLPKRK